jgi:hypothetical protein
MIVIDEDQYTPAVVYDAGRYTYSKQQIGTRYLMLALRTLADPNDPKDLAAVHALQDATRIEQPGGPGRLEAPDWDPEATRRCATRCSCSHRRCRTPTVDSAAGEQVDPVRRRILSASAWGGNPDHEAKYLNVFPAKNDGSTNYKLEVPGNVPVERFWSISVYNAQGYFEPNSSNADTVNNITGRKAADGESSFSSAVAMARFRTACRS